MIISRTPYRVSLFGGGCDYKEYYSEYGALLIGFAIKKHCYILCRPLEQFSQYAIEAYYSKADKVLRVEDIRNPAIRGTLQYLKIKDGIHIAVQADIPARTGLGASSTFVVGLINVLKSNFSNKSLADTAIHIERNLLQEKGGIQDQIFAAYGGVNSITIDINGNYDVRPLPVCDNFLDELRMSSTLLYTGMTRKSFKVAQPCRQALQYKKEIHNIAQEAKEIINTENLLVLGNLLIESWKLKKKVSKTTSNNKIDDLCNKALHSGAIGVKLLGAGGGGFIYCLVNRKKMERFKSEMSLPYIDVDFDRNGSTIIFNNNSGEKL